MLNMKYKDISQSGVGRSAVCAIDDFQVPVNVGVGAKLASGTATFNIEYTLDDVDAITNWYVAPGFSAVSASTGGSITIPCKAICINITSGTGAVVAAIVQAGPA
jgi:hypothetical protein